ncbi:MAG: urea transport system ATP-binding protein, partial [Frankiaceae bacterium]|nr:urea transport system ATP-binding protein [Frankiaceae bacterium]
MLRLENVTAGYGRTKVLFDVTIEVPNDGVLAVFGHNGAGKTTLVRTAAGLVRPATGRVWLDGEDVTKVSPAQRVARGLGYVPQGNQAFPLMTTRENLQLVADGRGTDGKLAMDEVVDLFPALAPLMNRRAGLLSGGQRQQLSIARALVRRPRMLLLDEPTEGIQPTVVRQIEDTIAALAGQRGLSVLLVEQHVGFAQRLAERYAIV